MDNFINFEVEISENFRFAHQLTKKETLNVKRQHLSHSHPTYEIYYLISGDVNYTIAGNKYHINPGEIVIVNSFSFHTVDVSAKNDYERFVLEFYSNNIQTINGINPISRFFNADEFIHIIPKQITEKYQILDKLYEMKNGYDKNDEYANHVLVSNITKFAVDIAKIINIESANKYNYINTAKKNINVINATIKYINQNITKNISIDKIAKEVGFSKSYLQHIFKETIGTSILQYISSQKMQIANYLLSTGSAPQYVCDYLGYKYYPTFSSTYKKIFDRSPRESKKE